MHGLKFQEITVDKRTHLFKKLCIAGAMLGPASAYSSDNTDELAELMALLDAETELATKSKMNADFVPGMVSVLHGETLRKFGIEKVYASTFACPRYVYHPGKQRRYRQHSTRCRRLAAIPAI